jgi:nitrile hydratase accessory protein
VSAAFPLSLTTSVEAMAGDCALPRDNGEFVFDEPWQGRAFAIAVLLVDRLGVSWTAFQRRLITAIASDPRRQYYESWAAALESLVVDYELVEPSDLERATRHVRLEAESERHSAQSG